MNVFRFISGIPRRTNRWAAGILLVCAIVFASGCVSTNSNVVQSPEGREPMIRVDSSAPEILPPSAH